MWQGQELNTILPQEAPNNMLEQSYSLSLDKTNDHIAQDRANGIEALIRCTDVPKTRIVEQDLLNDEDCDRLRQLATCLHDPQAEWYDLCCKQKGDRRRGVCVPLCVGRACWVERSI